MDDARRSRKRSRVAVAGASGLIGGALVRSLTADGHEVVRLVRHRPRSADEVRWDPEAGRVDTAGLTGCDAVVNLAGAGVGDHRWTDDYKTRIRSSRVHGTTALAEAVASMEQPPRVFLNGSAIGFYGETGDHPVDEEAPAGEGFLPSVCQEWEAAAAPARHAGVRTVFARTGLVVARGAAPGAGSSRSSGQVSAGGWATARSTGRSCPCTTRWPRSATSWTARTCPAPSI